MLVTVKLKEINSGCVYFKTLSATQKSINKWQRAKETHFVLPWVVNNITYYWIIQDIKPLET